MIILEFLKALSSFKATNLCFIRLPLKIKILFFSFIYLINFDTYDAIDNEEVNPGDSIPKRFIQLKFLIFFI